MEKNMEIQRHFSGSPFERSIGFCRALRVGDTVHVSGTAPIGDDTTTVGVDDPYRQAQRCLELITAAIDALAEGCVATVVRSRVYLVYARDWHEVARAHGERFSQAPPASTFVVVAGLLDPAWRVEIEAEAVLAPG